MTEALFGVPINTPLEELLPAPLSVWFQQALTTVLPVPGENGTVPDPVAEPVSALQYMYARRGERPVGPSAAVGAVG